MMTGCDPARHGVFDHRYYDAAGRPDEGEPLGPGPRADLLAAALRGRPVGRQPERAGDLSRRSTSAGVVVSGMDAPAPRRRALGLPRVRRRLRAEVPDYTLRYFWKRAPQSLEELAENARLTAESFRGRAEGGCSPTGSCPTGRR